MRAYQKKGGERQSHNRGAAHPLHKKQATPPARQHQRRHPRGPPKGHRRITLPNPATPSPKKRPTTTTRMPRGPEERTPRTRQRTRQQTSGGPPEKKTDTTKTRGGGGTETKGPKTGKGGGEHQRAKTRQRTTQPPPAAKKKLKKAGGHTPPTVTPAQSHATGSPNKGLREWDGARAGGHTLQHPNQKDRVQEKPKRTHTHHEPQPGMAECSQNPYRSTHALDPG